MDDDCLLLILENLDLSSLLSLVQAHERFRNVGAYVYKREFSQSFEFVQFRGDLDEKKGDIQENNIFDTINIEKFDVISKLYKYFGNEISSVSLLSFPSYSNEFKSCVEKIMKLINDNSDGLITLKIGIKTDLNPLRSVKKPFKDVKNLIISNDIEKLNNEDFTFDEMFPKLEAFALHGSVYDRKSIGVLLPHLDHLRTMDLSEWHAEELIKMNPQITSWSNDRSSLKFLKFLSDQLPSLQYIKFMSSKGDNENADNLQIHFNNVTHFRADRTNSNFAEIVTFDHLQEFHLFGFLLLPEWIDFIESNVHLKKIIIYCFILNEQFVQLKIPNVTDATIKIMLVNNVDVLIEFFEENTNLKRLTLESGEHNFGRDKRKDLKSKLKKEWTFSETNYSFTIERKNVYLGFNALSQM